MANVYCIVNESVLLSTPTRKIHLQEPLAYSNANAHAMQVTVFNDDGSEMDLTGIGVVGNFKKSDGDTVTPIMGTVDGNVARVILSPSCYVTPGRFVFTMDLTDLSDTTRTVLWVEGMVEKNISGTIIDPGTPVGNIAQAITDATNAAQSANTAATNATEAAETAEAAAESINNTLASFATSTSGPSDIITISDGADNVPVKTLSVAIEPKQDLHGYDKPWVGGAGKNLLSMSGMDMDKTMNGITLSTNESELTIRGTATAEVQTNATLASQYTQMPMGPFPAGTYTIKATGFEWQNQNDRLLINARYSDNSNVENAYSKRIGGSGSSVITFTATQEFKFGLFMALQSGSTFDCVVKVQFESGSAATDYEPYSNICPITGWDEATVTRTGKNLFNPSANIDKWVALNGIIAATAGALASQKIRCVKNDRFTISLSDGTGTLAIAFYSGSGEMLARNASGNVSSLTAIAPDGTEYLYAGRFRDSTASIQLELGSTATDYEPYTSDTLILPVQSISGSTVYGGTVTVNGDGTGTLVVDRAIASVDGLSFSDVQSSSLEAKVYISASLTNSILGGSSFVCDKLLGRSFQSRGVKWSCSPLSAVDSTGFAVFAEEGATKEEILERIDGANICYVLATPTTYSLTATQLCTLLGHNTLWCDAGQVEMEYRKDPNLANGLTINATPATDPGPRVGWVNLTLDKTNAEVIQAAQSGKCVVNLPVYNETIICHQSATSSNSIYFIGMNVDNSALFVYAVLINASSAQAALLGSIAMTDLFHQSGNG